jgi:hypothetical protein
MTRFWRHTLELGFILFALGGCPRIEAVARESGFESIFSIIMRRILVVFNEFNRKNGSNPLFRSRLSILGQPPRSAN